MRTPRTLESIRAEIEALLGSHAREYDVERMTLLLAMPYDGGYVLDVKLEEFAMVARECRLPTTRNPRPS